MSVHLIPSRKNKIRIVRKKSGRTIAALVKQHLAMECRYWDAVRLCGRSHNRIKASKPEMGLYNVEVSGKKQSSSERARGKVLQFRGSLRAVQAVCGHAVRDRWAAYTHRVSTLCSSWVLHKARGFKCRHYGYMVRTLVLPPRNELRSKSSAP
jgi:hypothetical protein